MSSLVNSLYDLMEIKYKQNQWLDNNRGRSYSNELDEAELEFEKALKNFIKKDLPHTITMFDVQELIDKGPTRYGK